MVPGSIASQSSDVEHNSVIGWYNAFRPCSGGILEPYYNGVLFADQFL